MDVGVVVTSEEEKMEKSVEWSGARGVGIVEAEERAGPREKENRKKEKKNQMSKHGGARGRGRAAHGFQASQGYTDLVVKTKTNGGLG